MHISHVFHFYFLYLRVILKPILKRQARYKIRVLSPRRHFDVSNMASSRYLGEEIATTKTVSYKKEFAWKIENWRDWWTSMEIDEMILSKTFTIEVEGISHEFKLAMLKYHSYDGIVDSIDVMLRLSLYYKGPFESIIMKPSFYLPIIGIETGHTFEASRLKKSCYTDTWCWSHNWFNVNMDDILENGNLTFACLARINVVKRNSDLICMQEKLCSKKPWYQRLPEMFDFDSDETGMHFDQLSDIEIICTGEETKRSFRCHKLVLSLGSQYFRTMFSGSFSESKGKVEVPDISSATMAKLLQYLYTGDIDRNKIDLDLFSTSNKYQVEDLQAVCELEISTKLSMETAPMAAVAADMCGSDEFKKYVFQFVAKYWKHMKESERSQWLENNPALLSQILSAVYN